MVRFGAVVFCLVSIGCFGQVGDLDRQLASGEPSDVAWAAYLIGIQPAANETILFTSASAFEERVGSLIERCERAFRDVVAAFVLKGDLTVEESSDLNLQCRIEVVDERPLPSADLPEFEGRWCAAPPAK